ncbi:MAG: glycosyltransferase family 2 protein, partial [Pirellulales bacterium]|nr:glycosyltransferase family 2 protein [Pirellulales bacterium]
MTSTPPTDRPQVSLVIPIRNEAGNIGPLIKEIRASLDETGFSWEILVINDGSTDESVGEVESVCDDTNKVHLLHLKDGHGKSAALSRGFACVRGESVVMLDGDGQDDPAEIPKMLTRLGMAPDGQPAPTAEAELVNGWKTPRLDPWHKTLPSRVFNLLVSWLTNVPLHDHNCGLKAMRREVAQQLPLATGMHRFIPVLAAASGNRIVEQPVHHRPRTRGVSKYGVGRFFRGLFDLSSVWIKLQTGRLGTA